MSDSNIPSSEAYELLTRYIDVMGKHGPDSEEARAFFENHKEVPGFEVNAREQYLLEREDRLARDAMFGPRSQ